MLAATTGRNQWKGSSACHGLYSTRVDEPADDPPVWKMVSSPGPTPWALLPISGWVPTAVHGPLIPTHLATPLRSRIQKSRHRRSRTATRSGRGLDHLRGFDDRMSPGGGLGEAEDVGRRTHHRQRVGGQGLGPDEVGAGVVGGVVVALPHQIRARRRRGVVHYHLGVDVSALVPLIDDGRLRPRQVGAGGRGGHRGAQTVGRPGDPVSIGMLSRGLPNEVETKSRYSPWLDISHPPGRS